MANTNTRNEKAADTNSARIRTENRPSEADGKGADARSLDRATLRQRLARGAYIPERIPQGGLDAVRGSNIEAAVNVALRSHEAVSHAQGEQGSQSGTGTRSSIDQAITDLAVSELIRLREARDLREWTQSSGHTLDNDAFSQNWKSQDRKGGAEHDVYFNPEEGRW